MDAVGLIVGLFVLISGVILGYLFSPRSAASNLHNILILLFFLEPKDAKVPPQLEGNLQRFSQNGFMEVPLSKIVKVNHDTYIFTYNLPDPDLPLGLHNGQHIAIQ